MGAVSGKLAPMTVRLEASALLATPAAQARARFGDRVARTFLIDDPAVFVQGLAFNAMLATAVREIAEMRCDKDIWQL